MFEPSQPSEPASSAMYASFAAAVLRRGRQLHQASLGLSALMLGEGVVCSVLHQQVPAPLGLYAALCAGVAEFYFALRVALDADLFSLLQSSDRDLTDFDRAMQLLRPRKQISSPPRSIEDRIRGAIRLMVWQIGLLAVQALCVGAHLLAGVALSWRAN